MYKPPLTWGKITKCPRTRAYLQPPPRHTRGQAKEGVGGLLTFIAQIRKAAFYFQRELKIQNPLGRFPLPAPPFQPVTDPQISPRQCKIPRNQTPRRELRGWGNTVSFYLKKNGSFFPC